MGHAEELGLQLSSVVGSRDGHKPLLSRINYGLHALWQHLALASVPTRSHGEGGLSPSEAAFLTAGQAQGSIFQSNDLKLHSFDEQYTMSPGLVSYS